MPHRHTTTPPHQYTYDTCSTMDSGGRPSAPPRMEVGDLFGSPKDLRAAASKRLLEDDRGYLQKLYFTHCVHFSVEIGSNGSWITLCITSTALCIVQKESPMNGR